MLDEHVLLLAYQLVWIDFSSWSGWKVDVGNSGTRYQICDMKKSQLWEIRRNSSWLRCACAKEGNKRPNSYIGPHYVAIGGFYCACTRQYGCSGASRRSCSVAISNWLKDWGVHGNGPNETLCDCAINTCVESKVLVLLVPVNDCIVLRVQLFAYTRICMIWHRVQLLVLYDIWLHYSCNTTTIVYLS